MDEYRPNDKKVPGNADPGNHLHAATVADLPGVKRVENRLAVRGGRSGRKSADSIFSSSEINRMTK
jgi:hypothetical protein